MASLIMWRDLTTKQRYELYQQYRKSNPNMKYSDMEKDFNDWYNNLNGNNKGDIKTGGYVIPYINGKYDTELAYKENEPTVILPEVTVTAKKPEKPTIDDASLLKAILWDSTVSPFYSIVSPAAHIANIIHDDHDNFYDYFKDIVEHNNNLLGNDYAEKHPFVNLGAELLVDGVIGSGAKTIATKTYDKLSPIITSVSDPYTTLGGVFGYYGNPIDRFVGTVRRTNNLNDKARLPELLRKVKPSSENHTMYIDENGLLQPTPVNSRFEYVKPITKENAGKLPITNFTYIDPVRSHAEWTNTGVSDLYVFDTKSLLKGHNPVSIEPSDAFFAGDMLKVKPNKATLISGNTDALTKFRKAGGNIYSTEELRRLYNEAINEGLNKSSLWDDYENALHNTYRKRSGNWKMKDVELLEDVTGLGRESSKTFSRSEYEALMQKGRSLDNKPKQSIIDIYSNSEKRSRLEDTKLNFGEVMYDPMSSIEDMMRQKWGIDLKNNKSN